ncbi:MULTISPECIES: alpha-glucan family phosphorylase [unclassified Pseudomonas]|uniref:alpha-glucan family phosphorylase n=1 Tax=unclassified Pseudomonas TaxID=196821 RepID=UPI002B239922|nr:MULTISPECIES: alpha-glucan family phosphorylase [unclassified Pseudomonas]MEA9976836.1 alpha-glucan family phosphorylase [Pseudomonas sp. RTS4]MEB0196822.1 alpha-glucan family phosphorylase [Pseudomonas sp. 5S4]MEB0244281.1 alpha-glucan family phosphorylase [Pseudomonas sp. 10S5]
MPFHRTPLESNIETLRRLAFDQTVRWSGLNDDIWRSLDSELWELTHNPCLVLNAVSEQRINVLLADSHFHGRVINIAQTHRSILAQPTWFEREHADAALHQVAYFSMEYMLSEALPIYSGGLGNVAGDQLKAASDLGVPVVAIGMLWQHGYFRQEIGVDGHQQALYPVNDTRQLPIEPLLRPDGSLLRLAIQLPGLTVWLRGWQATVGRNRLLLLDSNDPANPPPVRLLTGELYGGDVEMRLRQELVLGIGGWRLLESAGYTPDVLHLNDGHAAFAVLERARSYMQANKVGFNAALTATRAGNLFTTHTPVEAGFDRFPAELISKYLGLYVEHELGQPLGKILALGRQHANDADELFNMAFLATHCAGAVNAVSRLHGATSRHIFQPLFPRWPNDAVPIGHVTNGVHLPTWVSLEAEAHWQALHGDDLPWRGTSESRVSELLEQVDDADLWQLRGQARALLFEFVRTHLARSEAVHGASLDAIESAGVAFDPQVLTLGFARRFATYKRPNLLLQDPERLLRILNHPTRPVQLLIAGKAHPADSIGQQMIRDWHGFIRRPETNGRVAFLEDYDMRVARHLVQGVDVWVNTPRRPWEASGTSGMKVLANGGLNLSQLDGWWAEACTDEVGWGIGDGAEHGAEYDAADADQLYKLLESEVVPAFYERDADGIPGQWIRRMRASMGTLVTQFSADRAVREYTQRYYLPAAIAYHARSAEGSRLALQLTQDHEQLCTHWDDIRFLRLDLQRQAGRYAVALHMDLGSLSPSQVRVQLYVDGVDGADATSVDLKIDPQAQADGLLLYRVEVPDDRPAAEYTARVIANDSAGLAVPLEVGLIIWKS